jgi:hypothetical protein
MGRVVAENGDLNVAEEIFRSLVRRKEPMSGPDCNNMAEAFILGSIPQNKGELCKAEDIFRVLVPQLECSLGRNHHMMLECIRQLRVVLHRARTEEEALELDQRIEKRKGEDVAKEENSSCFRNFIRKERWWTLKV